MTTFHIPSRTLKALTLFTSPKDIRIRLRNIHLFVSSGVLYAEATNGHILIRLALQQDESLIKGDYGQYLPELLEFGYFKLKDEGLIDLRTDTPVPQCTENDQYIDTQRIMPLFEPPGMVEVTERYKIALKYQVIIDKAITLITGLKNIYSIPQRFKRRDSSPDSPYGYRNGEIAIIVTPLRDE